MRSTDRGVACLSSLTIPLDHHGRLGPHCAAPDVGKLRQRRPPVPLVVVVECEADQPFRQLHASPSTAARAPRRAEVAGTCATGIPVEIW